MPAAFAKRKWVPATHHPWREAARRGAQERALREAAFDPAAILGPALCCALNAPLCGLHRAALRARPTKQGDV